MSTAANIRVNFDNSRTAVSVNDDLHKLVKRLKLGGDNPDGLSTDKSSALIKHLNLIMDGFASGQMNSKQDVFALACKAIDSYGHGISNAKMTNLAELLSKVSTKTPLSAAEIGQKLSVFSDKISHALSRVVTVANKSEIDTTADDNKALMGGINDLMSLGSPDQLGVSSLTAPSIKFDKQELQAVVHGDVMLALVFACLATYEAENASLRPIAAEAATNANAVKGLSAISDFNQNLNSIFQTYNAEMPVTTPPTPPVTNLDDLIHDIYGDNANATPPMQANPALVKQLKNAVTKLGSVGTPLNKLSFSIGSIPGFPSGAQTLSGWSKTIISALDVIPPATETPDVSAVISAVSVGLIDNVNAQLGITDNGNTINNGLSGVTADSSYQCLTSNDITGILGETKQATDSATTITSRSQAESQTRTTTAQAAMTATMSFLSQWGQILKTAASGQ